MRTAASYSRKYAAADWTTGGGRNVLRPSIHVLDDLVLAWWPRRICVSGHVRKIVQDEPTPPERFVPEIMPGLKTILARALAKEPEERYETAGEMAAEVREIVAAQAALNDTVPALASLEAPDLGDRPPQHPKKKTASPASGETVSRSVVM